MTPNLFFDSSTAPLKGYRGANITIRVPDNKKITDFKYLGVWCESFGVMTSLSVPGRSVDVTRVGQVLSIASVSFPRLELKVASASGTGRPERVA